MAGDIRIDGLVSGIDYTSIIKKLLTIESRPILKLKSQIQTATEKKTAFLTLSARLLALQGSADLLATTSIFTRTSAKSSNENVIFASGDNISSIGAFQFISKKLAQAHNKISTGYETSTSTVGQGYITIEQGSGGFIRRDTYLSNLNGARGVDRGFIRITQTNSAGNVIARSTVDLQGAVTINDVLNTINSDSNIMIRAEAQGDRLILTDISGNINGTITVESVGLDTTATDLGIAGSVTGSGGPAVLMGTNVNTIGRNTLLRSLNDGNGVRFNASTADLTINTTNGGSFNVDITSSMRTVGDVLDAINNATGNPGVTAQINAEGNAIQLIDNSGGGGNLTVSVFAGSNSNALLDLGLYNVVAENNGNSTAVSGRNNMIGNRLIPTLNSTLRKSLNGGSNLYNPDGSAATDPDRGIRDGSITITDRAGGSDTMNLSQRVYTQMNADRLATDNFITIAVAPSSIGVGAGNRIRVTDNTTGTQMYYTVSSIDDATNRIDLTTQLGFAFGTDDYVARDISTVSDFINTLNTSPNSNITASINPIGNGILIQDNTSGTSPLIIQEVGSGNTARDLGILTRTTGTAGAGSSATQIVDANLIGLPDDYFNNFMVTVGATMRTVTDFNGSTGALYFSDLGFDPTGMGYTLDYRNQEFDGADLDPQYISIMTNLSELRGGQGVAKGRLQITDRAGRVFTVDLRQDTDDTVWDVVNDINGAASGVGSPLRARINDTGDGILLYDPGPGSGVITVTELDGGRTARDLNIAGSSSSSNPAYLDGSYERRLNISSSDTLTDIARKVVELGMDITSNVINDGSGLTPYRLSVLSKLSGVRGRLIIDSTISGFTFSTVAEGQDAVLLYGSDSGLSNPQIIISPENTVKNIVPGLTLDLRSTSNSSVSITVTRDTENLIKEMNNFVTKFNDIIDEIKKLIKYDTNTNKKGILFGDSTANGILIQLSSIIQRPVEGISDANINTLGEVGIRLLGSSKISFDESKFRSVLETDFDEVRELFTRKRTLAYNTMLSDFGDGLGVNNVGGNDFRIEQRDGTTITIDLEGAVTVGDVISLINYDSENSAPGVTASISSDGRSLVLVDASSGTNNFKVVQLSGSRGAADLGINLDVGTLNTITGRKIDLLGDSGAAARMADTLRGITDTRTGRIQTRTEGLDDEIESFNNSIERLEKRVERIEQRLIKQFTALEKFLAETQGTMNILTGLSDIIKSFSGKLSGKTSSK